MNFDTDSLKRGSNGVSHEGQDFGEPLAFSAIRKTTSVKQPVLTHRIDSVLSSSIVSDISFDACMGKTALEWWVMKYVRPSQTDDMLERIGDLEVAVERLDFIIRKLAKQLPSDNLNAIDEILKEADE
jgi:hypothetical protein